MDTVIHCNIEKNARLIAMILDFDEVGKEFDWYEQHIANAAKHFEEQIEKLRNPPVFPDGSPIVTTLPDKGMEQEGKMKPRMIGIPGKPIKAKPPKWSKPKPKGGEQR